MAPLLPLTLDELLTTTRAVRTRLDLSRPVEREVVLECLAIAQQAPTASNMQNWHFIVVTDAEKRAALAELYRKGWEHYVTMPIAAPNLRFTNPAHTAMQARIMASLPSFIEHFHEIPVYVIPCLSGRCEGQPALIQSAMWGTIAPAAWSFMLAARARGLGTLWTSLHLLFEEEAAHLLGIAYADVMQACLIPVAYTQGTHFKPGWREPLDTIVHWETWSWLRVFTSANTAHLGHRGGQEREPRVVPSEKYAACRGSVSDGMRMIPACFARALQRCSSRIYMHFLLTFQGVMPVSKTRN